MKSGPLCALLWRILFQETGDSQSLTHSRPAECDSRQGIEARSDHPNRMVPPSRGLPSNMLLVVPASSGPVCHQVQATTMCFNGSRHHGLGSGYTEPVLGGSGSTYLPTGHHLGQSGGEVAGLPVQQVVPAQSAQSVDSAI